jgi:type VI secretion system protein VasI
VLLVGQGKFMKNLAFAMFVASSLSSASAAEECVSIENDLDRLACYDRASGRTPVASAPSVSTRNWSVEIEKSEFKDTTDVYMRTESLGSVQCNSYSGPETVTLLMRCKENTTSFFLSAGCHFASGHGGYGNVEYRIDDRPAGKKGFTESTNNKALGLWNGSKAIPFIKKLLGKERLLVRFTPYAQNPMTAEFNVSGIDEAIKPLRKACNW